MLNDSFLINKDIKFFFIHSSNKQQLISISKLKKKLKYEKNGCEIRRYEKISKKHLLVTNKM